MTPSLQKKLTINEIFYSLQGESYLAGLPCAFVRLTGCHQRCNYCDSEYAFYEGQKMTLQQISDQVQSYGVSNILITGGEPLLQENVTDLFRHFISLNYQVAVETGGNRSLEKVPVEVIKIMDLKTPGSGESAKNNYDNLRFLNSKDEVKFVVTSIADVEWALAQERQYDLTNLCHVSMSPIDRDLLPQIAEKLLANKRPIRSQIQYHKLIWPEKSAGY